MTFATSRPRRGTLRKVLRRMLLAIFCILLLPYVLTVLYLGVNPTSTLIIWRTLTGQAVQRTFVPLTQIASALPAAVIAAEDGRFCTHSGIDWQELRAAIEEADELSEARGGSTITQQVAKNLFLWPGRSVVRKALEMPLAAWIDLVMPKTRIMEIYLNVAEWGPDGVFGAEAGAQYAFGKPARAVSTREAALMAAILPNPIRRSARRPGPGVRRLAGIYETRARGSRELVACVATNQR